MSLVVLAAPFCLQAAAMLADELFFHRRRGLPLWERWGHPLDTLTFLATLVLVAAVAPSFRALEIYAAAAVASCLSVTKDEFVHAGLCSAGEHWIHSVSFILHPLVLLANALLWGAVHGVGSPGSFPVLVTTTQAVFFIGVQIASATLFMAYQTIYWNLMWKPTDPEPTR